MITLDSVIQIHRCEESAQGEGKAKPALFWCGIGSAHGAHWGRARSAHAQRFGYRALSGRALARVVHPHIFPELFRVHPAQVLCPADSLPRSKSIVAL